MRFYANSFELLSGGVAAVSLLDSALSTADFYVRGRGRTRYVGVWGVLFVMCEGLGNSGCGCKGDGAVQASEGSGQDIYERIAHLARTAHGTVTGGVKSSPDVLVALASGIVRTISSLLPLPVRCRGGSMSCSTSMGRVRVSMRSGFIRWCASRMWVRRRGGHV